MGENLAELSTAIAADESLHPPAAQFQGTTGEGY